MCWTIAFAFLITAFAATPEKKACTARELTNQDCRLYARDYNLRLLPKTIAWTDGKWHTVDPMPLGGEAVQWEKITFEFLGEWPVLQLLLWDKGMGETKVQSLHWFVNSTEKRKLATLKDGVVRRRRPEPGDKPKYLYDTWETYAVRVAKGGKLEVELDGQKTLLDQGHD